MLKPLILYIISQQIPRFLQGIDENIYKNVI